MTLSIELLNRGTAESTEHRTKHF